MDSFDSKHGASCGRSKIRQFLISEIEKLIDKEMQQLGKSTKIHMNKQNMTSNKMSTDKQNMMSALQLLEIFERAGDGLDQFVQWRQCNVGHNMYIFNPISPMNFFQQLNSVVLSS